uniref:Thioredoxin domain-containing protein n=1 Tax=Globisporangium ultimum (strain ATCC 200006 / CBS 805.95 / DAOM BR144) TaxID=431595 RepID=K3WN65_GLOUD
MSCVLNHAAPDLTLVDLETGDSHNLLQIIKRTKLPTILLFYATWSRACVKEVQDFEAWSKQGHNKFANFILVNLDQNIGATLEFLDQKNPETGKPRVCRDFRHEEAPTVMHFGCADVPEPYAVTHVPHKAMIDVDGIVRRNADNFHWDDIAGLLRHRSEKKVEMEVTKTATFLFPSLVK